MRAARILLSSVAFTLVLAQSASANFHLMQVEQVIGGVSGATTFQAIQLRMRATGENFVSNGRLIAHDATGANPVVLIAFPGNVTNGSVGSRVLVSTANFSTATSPALTPDFVLTNRIPAGYLAAGSMTYEDNFGTIYWRLSWGGAGYTGSGTGAITNDADGNFSPDFGAALPSTTQQALKFKFGQTAASVNNANDYALTAGAAVFRKNNGDTATVITPAAVGDNATVSLPTLGRPSPNPVRSGMTYSIFLPRETSVHLGLVDLEGREIRGLLDQSMSAGQHVLTWSVSDRSGGALPAGVYFLRLDADGVRRMQKLALVR